MRMLLLWRSAEIIDRISHAAMRQRRSAQEGIQHTRAAALRTALPCYEADAAAAAFSGFRHFRYAIDAASYSATFARRVFFTLRRHMRRYAALFAPRLRRFASLHYLRAAGERHVARDRQERRIRVQRQARLRTHATPR